MRKGLCAAIVPAVLIFFGSCSSTPITAFSGNRVIPDDFTGVIHGSTNTEEENAYLDYLGVKWILQTFNWSKIERKQGQWNFETFDILVDNLNAEGIKVLGVLAYDTKWLNAEGSAEDNITARELPYFLEYVKKTVGHYKGRVDAWCIWNEPNSSRFWKGSREDFFELTRHTAVAIREVDSDVKILGGAFNRGIFRLPKKFIKGLFESGAMDSVDAVAFHPYELNPARTLRLYDQFRKIVEGYGFGDRIWITEVGYPTGGLYPTRVQEKIFPGYIIKTFVNLAAAGTPKLLWYELFDPHERSGRNSEHFFGLVRSTHEYTSKGAEAFRLCANYLPGKNCYVLEPGQDGLPRSIRAFWFSPVQGSGNNSSALVLWYEGVGSKQVRLRLPGTAVSRDPISGSETAIPAETVIKAGKIPVFITWNSQDGEEKPIILGK